jgi:Xaa-Pro aminopeptidase
MEWMPAPFLPGMTVTDEPGIYLPGKFGVRIENTLLIVPYIKTEFGEFLQFESLTLCPIDTSLIDLDIMLPEEIDWLNNYHDMVYEKLSPYLTEDEKEWLREATKAV